MEEEEEEEEEEQKHLWAFTISLTSDFSQLQKKVNVCIYQPKVNF